MFVEPELNYGSAFGHLNQNMCIVVVLVRSIVGSIIEGLKNRSGGPIG